MYSFFSLLKPQIYVLGRGLVSTIVKSAASIVVVAVAIIALVCICIISRLPEEKELNIIVFVWILPGFPPPHHRLFTTGFSSIILRLHAWLSGFAKKNADDKIKIVLRPNR